MLSLKIESTSQLWAYFFEKFYTKILNNFGLQVNLDVRRKVWTSFVKYNKEFII
jgi:hypothetical protein